jgi:hypothetical protein
MTSMKRTPRFGQAPGHEALPAVVVRRFGRVRGRRARTVAADSLREIGDSVGVSLCRPPGEFRTHWRRAARGGVAGAGGLAPLGVQAGEQAEFERLALLFGGRAAGWRTLRMPASVALLAGAADGGALVDGGEETAAVDVARAAVGAGGG